MSEHDEDNRKKAIFEIMRGKSHNSVQESNVISCKNI